MNDHKGFVFGLHVWKESCTQNFFRLGLSQLKSVEEFSHESFLCFVSTIESFVLNLSRLCLPPKQSDRSKFLLDLFGGSIQGLRHSSHASYLPTSASTLLCWVCNVRLLYLDHCVVETILTPKIYTVGDNIFLDCFVLFEWTGTEQTSTSLGWVNPNTAAARNQIRHLAWHQAATWA